MIYVIIGPSGSGKTAIVERFLREYPGVAVKAVTTTTRSPRKGELDGVHYYFISNSEFEKLQGKNRFLECAEYPKGSGQLYGLTVTEIAQLLSTGKTVLVILEENGLDALKQIFKEVKSVYIKRNEILAAQSVNNRHIPFEEKKARLEQNKKTKRVKGRVDFVIDNNKTIKDAVDSLAQIIMPNETNLNKQA